MPRYRRRRYKKRRYNRKGMRYLKRSIKALQSNAELKYDDNNHETANYYNVENNSANPTAICCNATTQGTTAVTRIGSVVKAKRLRLCGYIANNGTTPEDVMVRLVVFRAKQSNNAVMRWNLLFQDASLLSAMRMEHKTRFKIYVDKTFTMGVNTEEDVNFFLPFKINIPLNSRVQYNGNTGTTDGADLEKNSLWIMAAASAATANNPTIYWRSRFTFYDS